MSNLTDLSDDYTELIVELYEDAKLNNNKVLSKVKGQFFVPDGKSRNSRFYPRSLWEKVLGNEEIVESLSNGMLGTLLHPTDPKMAHPLYSSHVVKNLWIDEKGKGMGEAFILDTPVGRIVDTFHKSKLVKLFTSSRAWGSFKEGKKIDGMPVVDEENYVFKTFDIVLDPGFREAAPKFESNSMEAEALESLSECYLNGSCDCVLKTVSDTMTTPLEEIEEIAETFLDNIEHIDLPKAEKQGRARQLLEDINTLLK